jgi:hypothetical protein
VDGAGLPAGGLGEPLRGAPGGGGEQHALALGLEDRHDAPHEGGLAGAGASGDHQDLARDAAAHRLALLRRQADRLAALEPGEGPLDVDRQGSTGAAGEGAEVAGQTLLGGVQPPQVDPFPAVRRRLDDHLTLGHEVGQAGGEQLLADPQQGRRLLMEALAGQVDVPAFRALLEGVEEARPRALGRLGRQAERGGHPVGALEADAVDVAGQPVGVVADHRQRRSAIGLVDADGVGGGDAVGLEEDHHLLDLALPFPGPGDLGAALGADARDLRQPLRALLDHLQGRQPEGLHQAPGHDLADAGDEAGAEVALDAEDGGRCHRAVGGDAELAAELAVLLPGPLEAQALAGLDPEEPAHRRHRLATRRRQHLDHAPGVVLAGEDDALEGAVEALRGRGRGGAGGHAGGAAMLAGQPRAAGL